MPVAETGSRQAAPPLFRSLIDKRDNEHSCGAAARPAEPNCALYALDNAKEFPCWAMTVPLGTFQHPVLLKYPVSSFGTARDTMVIC